MPVVLLVHTGRGSIVSVLDARVLPVDVSREEVSSWADAYEAVSPARMRTADCRQQYPVYCSPVFDAAITGIAQVSARYVHRHHGIFGPYYRPFIQQTWLQSLHRRTPQRLIGREWSSDTPPIGDFNVIDSSGMLL